MLIYCQVRYICVVSVIVVVNYKTHNRTRSVSEYKVNWNMKHYVQHIEWVTWACPPHDPRPGLTPRSCHLFHLRNLCSWWLNTLALVPVYFRSLLLHWHNRLLSCAAVLLLAPVTLLVSQHHKHTVGLHRAYVLYGLQAAGHVSSSLWGLLRGTAPSRFLFSSANTAAWTLSKDKVKLWKKRKDHYFIVCCFEEKKKNPLGNNCLCHCQMWLSR